MARGIIAIWMMIRQQMDVSSAYTEPGGRTKAEKEAFREEVESLAGQSDGQTMLCVAGDVNAHIGVVEPGDEESIGRLIWMGNKEQGKARTDGDVEKERVGGRDTFFRKKESHKITLTSGRHKTRSTYWWCGNNSSGG